MKTILGWNKDNMFFLTRDGDIEITQYGYPKYEVGGVYHYSRQGVLAETEEELDEFGRNCTDRQFIRLCGFVFGLLMNKENTFQSLSCKKIDDQYIARLELTDETLEMELSEMIPFLAQRFKHGKEK